MLWACINPAHQSPMALTRQDLPVLKKSGSDIPSPQNPSCEGHNGPGMPNEV